MVFFLVDNQEGSLIQKDSKTGIHTHKEAHMARAVVTT